MAGLFCLSPQYMLSLVVPLWALHLRAGPVAIGLAVAANSLIPFLYAIPVGTLVDRLGARRLLRIGSAAGAVVYLLYPLVPAVAGLIGLQILAGIFQSLNWQSMQTYASRYGRDSERPRLMARFGAATTIGTFLGPLMEGGLLKWGFTVAFVGLAAWLGALAVLARILPPDTPVGGHGAVGWRALVPRLDQFAAAGRLLRSPGVLLVMLGTFYRLSTYSMQRSFYPVLLHHDRLSGPVIGLLVAASALASAGASALAGGLAQRFGLRRLLLMGLAIGIVGQAASPLVHRFWPLLALSLLFGGGLGLTLPVLLTLIGTVTPPEWRSTTVALRNGMSRLASTIVPFLLGLLVAGGGLALSFYVVGGLLLIGVGLANRLGIDTRPAAAAS